MMLHADMALLHRFRVRGSRNEASCKSTSRCSKSRTTSRIVCIILYNVCIVILKVGTIFRSPTEHTVDNKARKLLLKHISLHSAVVECLPKDWKVCGSSLYHGILLWRWALHLHLTHAAYISIMLLRPVK